MRANRLVSAIGCFLCAAGLAAGQNGLSLRRYLTVRHLDNGQPPLIAIDVDHQTLPDGVTIELAGFDRRLVKAGGLNVIAPLRLPDLEDSDIPNPYDALDEVDKLEFLLASLSPAELKMLTTTGISADQLQGETKGALLSLMPKPFTFQVGQDDGSGFSPEGDQQTIPPDSLGQIKLQLHRGLQIEYNAKTDNNGGGSAEDYCTLDYRGSKGMSVVQSNLEFGRTGSRPKAHIVPGFEKKSGINWVDPRLGKVIDLPPAWTIGEALAAVRQQTGFELIADARVAKLELDCFGGQTAATDLLRGIALTVGGAFRQVGPVYFLAPDIEGEAAKDTRILAQMSVGNLRIQDRVKQWKEYVASKKLYSQIGYGSGDTLGLSSIPDSEIQPDNSVDWDKGWIPRSQLPSPMRSALDDYNAVMDSAQADIPDPSGPGQNYVPDPAFKGKVKLTTTYGYRFILPDGRTMEYHQILKNPTSDLLSEPPGPSRLPLTPAKLPAGSAVGFASEDPGVVARECALVKSFGIPEVWLDSRNPAAISAAVRSGATVDLVVHPWWLLRSEGSLAPDTNILGQTGSQLQQIAEVSLDPKSGVARAFADCRPLDDDLAEHLSRLLALIPKTGIHRLIVEDTVTGGYEAPAPAGTAGQATFGAGVSLQTGAPSVFQFGYTVPARVGFIRERGLDPVDLLSQMVEHVVPSNPFFESQGGLAELANGEAQSAPPAKPDDDNAWHKSRNEVGKKALASLMDELNALGIETWLESGSSTMPFDLPFRVFGQKPDAGVTLPQMDGLIELLSVNPATAENSEHTFVYRRTTLVDSPTCFDLSGVPPDDFETYLRYLFKKS